MSHCKRPDIANASVCDAVRTGQLCAFRFNVRRCRCTCDPRPWQRIRPPAPLDCSADAGKVIAITPGGRQFHMEILARYMSTYHLAGVVHEWHVWENARTASDAAYMLQLNATHHWVRLVPFPSHGSLPYKGSPRGIKLFWDSQRHVVGCGVRVRFDDDIVWADAPERLRSLLQFTHTHRSTTPLVYGNVVNNPLWAWAQQEFLGKLRIPRWPRFHRSGFNAMWKDGLIGARVHRLALEEGPASFRSDDRDIEIGFSRFSINVIAWAGENLRRVEWTAVRADEEHHLARDFPADLNSSAGNVMYGGFVAVHYAYGPQLPKLQNRSDLLQAYANLSVEALVKRTDVHHFTSLSTKLTQPWLARRRWRPPSHRF